MEEKFQGKDLVIISVHTPEFDFEKERARVVKATQKYKLNHPVYMDNDYAFWNALGNRYWPAFYLFDKQGNLRHATVGEMHNDTSRAEAFDNYFIELLGES